MTWRPASLAALAITITLAPSWAEELAPGAGRLSWEEMSCQDLVAMGIEQMTNVRAAIARERCGIAPSPEAASFTPPLVVGGDAPTLIGGTDVNLITGTETYPAVTQSEAFVWGEGSTIVATYNDSRTASSLNYSGISTSTDGGATFVRLNPSPFATGHGSNYGDPTVVYNRRLGRWYSIWLSTGCGGQGMGVWTSADGLTWTPGACAHNGFSDDRQSLWVDNNASSPYYGRMYVSWNDFGAGQRIFVTRSDDGTTWTPVAVTSTFIRNVQITGSPGADGTVFVAGMNENGGGFANRDNIMYRSTDGGASFTTTAMGPPYAAAGNVSCGYFVAINPIWRHMGWGQPAVGPAGTVHYNFCGRGVNPSDVGDIYYTRSTDNGTTWSAPIVLNQDQAGGGAQPQWMPSMLATPAGQVLATWYDRRNTSNGTNYHYWGRISNDAGATWLADDGISDVISPQPLQPDPNVQSCYAGDYNYITADAGRGYVVWTDGRNLVSGNSQQDVYFDIVSFCPTITLSPSSLPGGTVGIAYSQTVTASGGTPPYTYAVSTGSLPPGLALDTASGAITGVPTTAGSYPFTITATDSGGCSGSQAYTIDISCPPITVDPPTLPNGSVGTTYSQNVIASGGAAPYTYAVTSGSLPPGLSLNATTGAIDGTATTPGSFPFTITATDSLGCQGSRAYTIDISCPVITVSPATLPDGTIGLPYSQTVSASGGTPPYTYSVTAGSLPPGLTLDSLTGLISGTPTTLGVYPFDVTAADAFTVCTGTTSYTVTISSCPPATITPTPPDGAEGIPYSVTFTMTPSTPPVTCVVTGTLPPGLALAGLTLSGTPTTAGSSTFDLTCTDAAACDATATFTIDIAPAVDYIAGEGPGATNTNLVRVATRDAVATTVAFQAYAAGAWGTNVGAGRIMGGTYDEIVTGPGPGAVFGPHVRGFFRTGTPVAKVSFFAYGTLKYGVNASSGDIDTEAVNDELLTGPGPGDVFGPHVRGWNVDGQTPTPMSKVNFYAYLTLRYGVNSERGDVDGDGYAELLTGPGPGQIFSAQVKGWNYDGIGLTAIAKINFNSGTTLYGAELDGGDVDADGFAEIVVTAGPGPTNPSRFRGYDYDGTGVVALAGYDTTLFASTAYGGRVALGDLTADGRWDMIAGAGRDPAADSTMLGFEYVGGTLSPLAGPFVPFGTARFGVAAGAGALGHY